MIDVTAILNACKQELKAMHEKSLVDRDWGRKLLLDGAEEGMTYLASKIALALKESSSEKAKEEKEHVIPPPPKPGSKPGRGKDKKKASRQK